MQDNYLNYQSEDGDMPIDGKIPAFNQKKAYAFDTPELELYHELNEISEEVGRCRRNQLN